MSKLKTLVFSGYGLNCEEETKFAFELVGANTDIVHINDIIERPGVLQKYQIFAMPGGFSYGDDTGSGNAYASKLKNHLEDKLKVLVNKDILMIGMCNGFQILVNLGLLPAIDNNYGERQVALLPNANARYTTRWVDLKIQNDSPWLKEVGDISLPMAHGEGNFYAEEATLKELNKSNQIALRYVQGEICKLQDLVANPNGSLDNIAGITNKNGKILGLMPHPERAIFFTQLPHWTLLKELLKREGKELPKFGPGLKFFQNAIQYFK